MQEELDVFLEETFSILGSSIIDSNTLPEYDPLLKLSYGSPLLPSKGMPHLTQSDLNVARWFYAAGLVPGLPDLAFSWHLHEPAM